MWLWGPAILTYVVFDGVTTVLILEAGYTELNPVVSGLLSTGGVATVFASKAIVTAVLDLLWKVWPDPYAIAIPVTVTVLGLVAGVNNVLLLV